uniref:Spermidine synthase n=1 Tax=Desulfacinum infernum TaxID=35837 RepID=A0A832A2M4_9BACT
MIPGAALFLLACAALAHEVLLVRLLHIVHEHHFAFMILSLALLGYGAGATGLTLAQRFLCKRPAAVFAAAAVFLSWAVLLSVPGLSRLFFNPLEILWDVRQTARLAALYLSLSVPFFAAGLATGLAFRTRPEKIHRLYLADLSGAALGAALAVGLLQTVDAVWALRLVSAVAASAALLVRAGNFLSRASICVLANLALQVLVPHAALMPSPNPYKGLAYARELPETRLTAERFGPMGWVAVLESPRVPFRSLSGWSLSCAAQAPSTPLGLFVDGAGPVPLFSKDAFPADFSFRDCLMITLPYRLAAFNRQSPQGLRALLLGLHGNLETVVARLEGVAFLDVVERNAHVAQIVPHLAWGFDFKDGLGAVRVHVGDPRRILHRHTEHYDVIHPVTVGVLSASAAGGASLMEVHDATVEAFGTFLDRLTPDGYLALPHSLSVPPQATLRFVATAEEALRRRGAGSPQRHMAVIHDWNTALLLVKKSEIRSEEQDFIRRFAVERSFDMAYLPDMTRKDAQRFHVAFQGSLHGAVTALLSDRAKEFMKTFPFSIEPVTDNRPYVFHFFRWKTFGALLRAEHGRGVSLLSWGVPVLLAALAQACAAAVLFIAAPLAFSFKAVFRRSMKTFGKTLIYFGSLGLAFLFVETVMIQKNVFLLGHPVYGFAGTVGPFLLWAGLGSLASTGWVRWLETRRFLRRRNVLSFTAVCAGAMVGFYGMVWVHLVPWAHGLHDALRWAYAVLGPAPVAFFLGMPMPLGLRSLGCTDPDLVPWAWAINGCASVISALAAALTAMTYGFAAVLAASAALYGLAASSAPRMDGSA